MKNTLSALILFGVLTTPTISVANGPSLDFRSVAPDSSDVLPHPEEFQNVSTPCRGRLFYLFGRRHCLMPFRPASPSVA